MSTQQIAGSFPLERIFGTQFATPDAVLYDGTADPTVTGYSAGVIRSQQLTVQPSLAGAWEIVGWSIRARVGFRASGDDGAALTTGIPLWARWGTLWAGVAVDANMPAASGGLKWVSNNTVQAAGGAFLPSDLSTFSKIWTPDDPLEQIYDAATTNAGTFPDLIAKGTMIGLTYMLPAPVTARAGAQLQMVLVLTRSLIAGVSVPIGTPRLCFGVKSCEFSVLYDDQPRA